MSDSETKRSAGDPAATPTASEPGSSEVQAENAPACNPEATADTPADAPTPSAPPREAGGALTEEGAERSPAADAPAEPASAGAQQEAKSSRFLDRSTALWLCVVAVIFAVELFIYGHAGIIRVCVGLEGQTDFSLLTRGNVAASPRSHPFCAERRNIGMYPNAENAAQAALEEACQRGATLTGGEMRACLRREQGWIRQVHKENVPPWDKRVYRRLLWLD